MSPVTLNDVAARAGVHFSTASRVLNGQGRVSADTRERILKAARDLDFVPNAQARFLVRGTSRTFGVLSVQALELFTLPVFGNAVMELGRHDIALLHYDVGGEAEDLPSVLTRMRSRRIEALLILASGPIRPLPSLTAGLPFPAALAFGVSDDPADTCYTTDDVRSGRLVADHLLDVGRTRFAHVTAADSLSADQRYQGFRDRLAEDGVRMTIARPLRGEWNRGWGVEAATRLLPRLGQLDAIFCGNDEIAVGVEQVLTAHGVRVPDDIALVGYDNQQGRFAASTTYPRPPHLTTINPRLDEIGRSAAVGLMRAAADEQPLPKGRQLIPGELVVGETTGA